ncbi:uncharacterized protein At4g26485 [Beta vulgaris subsp. vulgaris]|uniref:uncharacterized protein At4g26485 n=1 Tax=Beta vulgaris subsp. vulgaris TaxID=3555 RepID=UPI002549747E|nr:uncharacterized protein At4g26485 [Beta vulgaris subsp. vulgaris]XP_057249885.1 uncharacterized protein At4g26485 [Beta vulgaris subsp. vulgaris]
MIIYSGEPISGSSTVETSESHYNNLDVLITPHIVVDLKNGDEEDATTTKRSKNRKKKNKNGKKLVIDHGDKQVIPEIVLEKNVTNTVISRLPSVPKEIVRKIGLYTSAQRILLVGEGDFSFSSCLAVAFGTSHNITATSLNSEDFLIKNYEKFLTNKAELETRGSMVLHGVNARKMAKHPIIGSMVFDRIVFNFPHAGKFDRTDTELRLHQKLLRDFLKNAKKMIGEDGEIHITSKSNGFFLEWDIPKIGSDHKLNLIQVVNFEKSKYPGYNTKRGFGGDQNFHCIPSKTYKFGLHLNENSDISKY